MATITKSNMQAFVLDCSITMAWLFEDESCVSSDTILELLKNSRALVPTIWPLEVANVLLIAQRKKRITSSQVSSFTDALATLPITIDETTSIRAMHSIYHLAEKYKLTIYDAASLELAFREKIPLASLDKDLIKAAHRLKLTTL